MSQGATNWPFFTLMARLGFGGVRGGDEQVGLAAEEGGNLEHGVDGAEGVADLRALLGRVDVGQHGQLLLSAMARRMRQPSARPGPRKLWMEVRLALS